MATESRRIKIKLYGFHFAYLEQDFLREFSQKTRILKISDFIKKEAYLQFKFRIQDSEDVLIFKDIIDKHYYSNQAEWVREKMRLKMNDYVLNKKRAPN